MIGLRRRLWAAAGLGAIGAIAVFACLGVGGILAALYNDVTVLDAALWAGGAIGAGLVLGIPLLMQAWAGWKGKPSRSFQSRRFLWLLLLLPLSIVIGMLVTSLDLAVAIVLPPLYVLAMALLPWGVLFLLGWVQRGRGGSWRDVVVSMGGGGFVGSGLSFAGEVALFAAVGFVTLMAVVLFAATTPGGLERLWESCQVWKTAIQQGDYATLAPLLLSPVVIVLVLAGAAVVFPLMEEAFKTLTVGIAGCWLRPHPARAFLLGVASGAGFALAENVFSGAGGGALSLVAGPVIRSGTTVIHCLASGLVGWGWGQLWTQRRPWRLLGAYAAAVALHGVWNAAVVGIMFLGIAALAATPPSVSVPPSPTLLGVLLGVVALLALLFFLVVASLVALLVIGGRLAWQRPGEAFSAGEGAPATVEPGGF